VWLKYKELKLWAKQGVLDDERTRKESTGKKEGKKRN
jgi:hypothetical protein